MPFLTADEVLDTRINLIEKQFPEVHLEFSPAVFDEHLELWVYVLDVDRFDQVRHFCKESVEPLSVGPFGHVQIIVQPWRGSWPEGQPDPNWQQNREAALERYKKYIQELRASQHAVTS